MMRIMAIAAALPAAAMAASGYQGQSGSGFPFPEILQDPERENCAIYVNHFQPPAGDAETWDSPAGPVTFKFFRGEGNVPDQAVAWDVPEGYAVLPHTITLEEHESDSFCIVEYLGG